MTSFHSWHRYAAILVLALVSSPAFAQVSISVDIAPPPLIVEDQPPMPDDGLIWTPGYWAYDDNQGEYYWVDGAWVQPPEVGFLWTPAYWGWDNGAYGFHQGYWGPTVGFYGGVNYGHGYWGRGYGGGRWDNGHFAYNTAANNVGNAHVYKTYADRTGYRAEGSNRVSYNGGHGGVTARPTAQEQQASQGNHVQATPQQQTHFQQASQQRTHQVKVDKAAAKPGATPAAAATPGVQPNAQPGVNKQDNQFTGGENKAQKKDQPMDKAPAPVNNAAQADHQAQVKAQQDAHVTGQQPESAKPEAPHVNPPQPQEQPHVAPMEQHAAEQHVPEEHHAEGPGAAAVQHAAAPQPQSHPAPQAQHEQKPAAAQGQAKPEGGQGGGGGDHHQDGH